ncbi:hypothetical protein SAY87_004244 [Trapa incisa]|uniref:TCP domain-containing protein n=1 Tax=Trapa incisa TaxID=236973 RepID=A0AAN7JNJ2_9MYRT|nr:hypothetical protein SAY87_004244 [Trapa incisa]
MRTNSIDEAHLQARQVEQKAEVLGSQAAAVPSISRQWSSFRNPRIVRVSRSFGGKDRHSKVCTLRGLRDRRIRLSVPTAIQLYDLQEKLELRQPSKVIDWLLDATKQEIDKLPPLQMPQGFFSSQFHPQMMLGGNIAGSRNLSNLLLPHEQISSRLVSFSSKINESNDGDGTEASAGPSSSRYWDINLGLPAHEVDQITVPVDDDKGKSMEMNELQKRAGVGGGQYAQSSVGYSSTLPSGSESVGDQFEPSSLYLSQPRGLQPQLDSFLQSNTVSLPSSSPPPPPPPPTSLPHGSQVYMYPPAIPTLFPAYPPLPYLGASTASEPKQVNHFQVLSLTSSSQPTLPSTSLVQKPFQTKSSIEFLHPEDVGPSQGDEQAN